MFLITSSIASTTLQADTLCQPLLLHLGGMAMARELLVYP